MSKNKRPPPKKAGASTEEKEDALTQTLCEMAIDLAEQEDSDAMGEVLQQTSADFRKLIKKCLHQKKDAILYEALERALHADIDAHRLLKSSIEEGSEAVFIRRDQGKTMEVNAFVIPLFARSKGGLDRRQCFQDQQAFDLLTQSFKQAQLESPDATVVLISHAYHMDEIDGITYSRLHEMIYEAYASITDMRGAATPAIDRSFGAWPEHGFAADDTAVELRFLLGFSLKAADDAFYAVPQDEAAADAYFAVREQRFQRWAEAVAPLMRRCLAADGAGIDVDFLYQDMFHGGKERGIAEYFMLQMMAELNHGLAARGIAAGQADAIAGPAQVGDATVLRVQLVARANGSLLACADKPLDAMRELEDEIADAYDALMTIGIGSLSLAMAFDRDGRPLEVRPYEDAGG